MKLRHPPWLPRHSLAGRAGPGDDGPELTDSVFAAEAAGHVVRHGGQTVLFAGGTGETTIFDTDALLESDGELPDTTTFPAPEAHHGVSIVLEDGTLLTTVGDEKARSGAVAMQRDGDGYTEIASSDQCPAIHGGTFEPVTLPEGITYTWRGVVRAPDDLACILGTDGSIHVMDPATGEITGEFPVVDPWEGPAGWQNPHPALTVHDGTAYVADPATQHVHAVNLATGEVFASVELADEPNEMAAALG